MGPRHKDRGEPDDSAAIADAGTWLQWGHGTKTVENVMQPVAEQPQQAASMGPRHEDRGEPSDRRERMQPGLPASMGPRH